MKFEAESDPKKLVEYCCGSNYFLEGEDVKLKPDSEYPDWLFTMDVKRPKPMAHEMEDKTTIEYYEKVKEEEAERKYQLRIKGFRGIKDR